MQHGTTNTSQTYWLLLRREIIVIESVLGFYTIKELYLLLYLFIINLFAFSIMGIDKYKAKKSKWRIREKTFFIISIIGGALGSLLGMVVFRHKTQHKSFYIGIPLLYLLNQIIIWLIVVRIIRQ